MAAQAACPCKSSLPTPPCYTPTPPPCEAPAAPVEPSCDCPAPVQPTCGCPASPVETPASDCGCGCNNPPEAAVKQESCCWQLSQEALFAKLCLSQCQLDKANALYSKYKCETQPIRDALKCEKTKLCQMLKGCASSADIKAQRKKIKDLKKDLKDKWNCYQDSFKEILTKDQLSKFKKYTREENSKYKKLKKNKCCCKHS